MPESIRAWPTLYPDGTDTSELLASLGVSNKENQGPLERAPNNKADGSIEEEQAGVLIVADNSGRVHLFLDGCYPLGSISIGEGLSMPSLFKHPKQPCIFVHTKASAASLLDTRLQPITIKMPILSTGQIRDFAILSSLTRELIWYATRVVTAMKTAWIGLDTLPGARQLGEKWLRSLEANLQVSFGRESVRFRFYVSVS